MSGALPQPWRRARYLSEVERTETELPLLPKYLPQRARESRRQQRRQELLVKMSVPELAEADGYKDGLADRQRPAIEYRSGEEYVAWYRGWKRGQAERPKREAWERLL